MLRLNFFPILHQPVGIVNGAAENAQLVKVRGFR